MAFVHGSDTVILGNEFALTGYLDQFGVTRDSQAVDVTTFGKNDREFIAGIGSGSMNVSGVFDAAGIDLERRRSESGPIWSPTTIWWLSALALLVARGVARCPVVAQMMAVSLQHVHTSSAQRQTAYRLVGLLVPRVERVVCH